MGISQRPLMDRVPVANEPDAVRPPRRRRLPGVLLSVFAVLVLGCLVFVWVRYYQFDPAKSRLSPREHPLYFPVLMIHIVSSSLALAACVLQIWPWLRRRHPRVHRISGRIYVLAGIYPAALTALVLTAWWPTNPINAFSDTLSSFLWIAITTYGFVLARQRRTADHRRWMLRSFALTISVIFNQLLFVPIGLVVKPMLATQFPGNDDVLNMVWAGTVVWMGWTVPFLGVSWLLEREALRRSARRAATA
ncbi:MAG TPA: DUF2306 domain-containing protein [Actinoplanes sp.]|jgi:uncharacterized membrane protein